MKTLENDDNHGDFNTGEMDKSRELYSKEGDNSSRFEGKTVPWEHTRVSPAIIGHPWTVSRVPLLF